MSRISSVQWGASTIHINKVANISIKHFLGKDSRNELPAARLSGWSQDGSVSFKN
jgi:hypothetical protein